LDSLGIETRPEQEAGGGRDTLSERLADRVSRGEHYDHCVPSPVNHPADRLELPTLHTQCQPEGTYGSLRALFEYQSLLVTFTGLPVASCSMCDTAMAPGEAATLASQVRNSGGPTVLVPSCLR
jgi:glycine dehydrogenase subunit 1